MNTGVHDHEYSAECLRIGQIHAAEGILKQDRIVAAQLQGPIFLPESFVENRDGLKPKRIYLVYVSQKDFFHESKCNFYEICSTKDHSSFSFFKSVHNKRAAWDGVRTEIL